LIDRTTGVLVGSVNMQYLLVEPPRRYRPRVWIFYGTTGRRETPISIGRTSFAR